MSAKRSGSRLLCILFFPAAAAACLSGCGGGGGQSPAEKISDEVFPAPSIDYDPQRYLCRKTSEPLVIDGRLDEKSWNEPWVLWTTYFTDIKGGDSPAPAFSTRAKMLWDDAYLYIAADIQEPHIRASVTARDGDVYDDNCFGVYMDPDGDTHEYYELAINPFGTVMDLLIVRPYRDGGPSVRAWDAAGLEAAVNLEGTVNAPGDVDGGWSVEMAIPWAVLEECAHKSTPPDEGDIWFVNFSRVHWEAEVENGAYVKATDPGTGAPVAGKTWTWSAQGIEDIHYPEMWGMVMFTNVMRSYGADAFGPTPVEKARWALRRIYYAEHTRYLQFGNFTANLASMGIGAEDIFGYEWPPRIYVTPKFFEAVIEAADDGPDLIIDSEGRLGEYAE